MMQQARRQSGERQQVETVVLEHGDERTRSPSGKLKVAGRNLETRNVAARGAPSTAVRAPSASIRSLRRSGPHALVPQYRRAGCSTSRCGRPAPGDSIRLNT